MDLSLPHMDGWEAIRRLKRDPVTTGIPIIACTAHVLGKSCERAVDAGCNAYLTKPCLPARLLAEVQRVLAPPAASVPNALSSRVCGASASTPAGRSPTSASSTRRPATSACGRCRARPDDPSRAIAVGAVEGLREAAHAAAADVSYFGHGTTVATNALIQHRGARTGLITTEGFRDLLEIGRQRRPHLYDLQADKPPVLVARELRAEVAERLRHDGRDREAARRGAGPGGASARLKAAGVHAVAICFLYCYVDPRHEQRVRRIVEEEFPDAFVTCSHEVAPEFREYRAALDRRGQRLPRPGHGQLPRRPRPASRRRPASGCAPHITQSNGGVMSFEAARAQPVRTVLSGPATGVVGALEVGRRAGFHDLITFDMGGTSTDVALIEDGRPEARGRDGGARLPAEDAAARHPHRRRRRRLHRLHRRRRAPEGRAALRRRRAWTRLLRPRQRGADRHRRERGAGDAQPDAPARRPHGRSIAPARKRRSRGWRRASAST